MEAASLLDLFAEVATTIRAELDSLDNWGPSNGHEGQYVHDVVADAVALPMLSKAGLGVVSEESGARDLDRPVVAVIDPVDGSTNAAAGIPWWATSICAVDAAGPLAGLVVNQATGVVYTGIRCEGSWRDGVPIAPSLCEHVSDSILILNDMPPRHLQWRQYRVLGAAALDLCAVADGTVDGFIDLSGGLAPWDHLAGQLICKEAGGMCRSLRGAWIDDASPDARTNVAATATRLLMDEVAAIHLFDGHP